MEEIASDVAWLPIVFVNTYFLGGAGGPWILVDTGIPGSAAKVLKAAKERFGASTRPAAIVLTHGHFDHSGNARQLAEEWDVNVYVHPLEWPYLTGKSPYPPKDPTVGGAIALMSRFFPTRSANLQDRLRRLDPDGRVPGIEGWQWIHTPGHSPGHVSLFRDSDRTLIGGDAFATMDMSNFPAVVLKTKRLSLPAPPFTPDWQSAGRSVTSLAELDPVTIACGHGAPMNGPKLAGEFRLFASAFTPPPHGRYVTNPAITDEHGIVSVPPPPPDPLPTFIAASGAAVLSGVTTAALVRGLRQ